MPDQSKDTLQQHLLDRARMAVSKQFPEALTIPIMPAAGHGTFLEWLKNLGPAALPPGGNAQTEMRRMVFGFPLPHTNPTITLGTDLPRLKSLPGLTSTLAHEMTHIRQLRDNGSKLREEFKLPYYERPHEREAFDIGDLYREGYSDIPLYPEDAPPRAIDKILSQKSRKLPK